MRNGGDGRHPAEAADRGPAGFVYSPGSDGQGGGSARSRCPTVIDRADARRPGHAGNGRSPRVLVLEGSDYASCLLREAGADRGLVVISPRDPRGALDRLADDGWDAAVLNLPIPRIPDDDLLARLETLGPDRRRRIVFLAGEITRPDTRRLLTRIARPYLTPPVEPAELLDLVLRVTNGNGQGG